MEEKRKGYKNIENQIAAEKRWLEKNPENRIKKARNTRKSSTKKFIKEDATLEEIELIKSWISEREKGLAEVNQG